MIVLVGVLMVVGALAGLLIVPDVVVGLVCSAPENIPCRPLTLECLFSGAGGLAAGLPAVPPGWGGFGPGTGPEPPRDYNENPVPGESREYAPAPPPGYQPPPPQSPQDALNDPEFKRAKDDWARDNADRVYGSSQQPESRGMSAGDVLVESIRNSGSR